VIPTRRRNLRDWDIFVEFFNQKIPIARKEKKHLLLNFFDVATSG
jgi:hypothetical protein